MKVFSGRKSASAFSKGGLLTRTVGTGGGYNPMTAIPGLHGYFEAQRADSITHAAGLVSEWRCLKTGYPVQQGTDPAKPIYGAISFGGAPGLSFDGVDDVLANINHPYPLVDYEMWLILSQGAAPGDTTQRYAFGMGVGSGGGATISRIVSVGVNRVRGTVGNGTAGQISNNTAVDFSSRHAARLVIKSTGITMEIDGTTVAETPMTPGLSNGRFRFGAFINTLPGNFHTGVFAAGLLTPLLSGSDKDSLQTWALARRNL